VHFGEKLPVKEMETASWYRDYDVASGLIYKLVKVFIEVSKIFVFIFYSTRHPINFKTSGAWT
jgi:hypothetical protein